MIKHVINNNGGTPTRRTSRSTSAARRTAMTSPAPERPARRSTLDAGGYDVTETRPVRLHGELHRGLRRARRDRRGEDLHGDQRRPAADS